MGRLEDLATRLPGGFVLLSPEAAELMARMLVRYARADHLSRLSPAAEHVRRTCLPADPERASGHPDRGTTTVPAPSGTWITTAQVAELLGFSQRHCSRLATGGELGPTRKVQGSWMVCEDEVKAFIELRRTG